LNLEIFMATKKTNLAADSARTLAFDFVRSTEAAALHSLKWLGRGDKLAADEAATDAMRGMLNLIDMRGRCVIGEGIKDSAPGIFKDEKLGQCKRNALSVNLAIDPIDGTSLTAKGLPGAISVLAATVFEGEDPGALAELPSFYSTKLAVGPTVKESGCTLDLDAPIETTLKDVSDCLNKRLSDMVVVVMDRPRHEELIERIRKAGVRIRLIGDGDVAMAIAPSMLDSAVDLYVGIGGSPEAVIAAAAIKSLGGQMLVRMWPRDDEERRELVDNGYSDRIDTVYDCADLAAGEDIIFVATGISDSPMLRGIVIKGLHAHTYSILMRARHRTVRYVHAIHDLSRKTVRLASDKKDHLL
jgi:fructose-1,6-bisphosphatase II